MVQRLENLVVIDGEVHGAFMPAGKDHLLTDVVLREGFHIHGGLYANNLTVEGPGIVDGPVMAKRDIIIKPPSQKGVYDKRVVFRCGLSAKLAISVDVPSTFDESPLNNENCIPLLIRGDVISRAVRLENAVVVGNVYANDAVIKDSIILGCALVGNKLVLQNSMAISFRAGSAEIVGKNSLWVPYGLAQTDILFQSDPDDEEFKARTKVSMDIVGNEPPAQDAGKGWLRYLALCPTEHGCGTSSWFICHKHLAGTCDRQDVRMTEQDRVKFKRGDKPMVAVTVAPRMVDLKEVKKNLQDTVDLLSDFLFLEHYSAASRKQILQKLEERHNELGFGFGQDVQYKLLENVAKFALPPGDSLNER